MSANQPISKVLPGVRDNAIALRDRPATPSFTAERLNKLASIERWHFWFVARKALVFQMLRLNRCLPTKRILDLGCGTGSTVEALLPHAGVVLGLDLLPDGLHSARLRLPAARWVQSSAERIPLRNNSVDGVLILDLLEHTEHASTLDEAARILKPGGWAMISVPAFPFLWSHRDEAAGHQRRYTKAELLRRLRPHFRVVQVRYFQFLLFLILMLSRFVGRGGPLMRDLEERPMPVLNRLLTSMSLSEVRLSRWLRLPWGSSLVVLCRKDT